MTTLLDKLNPEVRAKLNALPADQQERATYWLTKSEYLFETPYSHARWICMYFQQPIENFYDLFAV